MTDTTERTSVRQARCPCGRVSLDVAGPPLVRIVCHCSICRAFNEAPFAELLGSVPATSRRPRPDS